MGLHNKSVSLLLAAAASGLLLGVSASNNTCTSLTSNLLTSDSCPSSCGSFPCVLFSPSLEDSKPCLAASAAGECLTETDYTLPGTTTTCNVTYQCLNSIVLTTYKQWLLVAQPISNSDAYTVAWVTEIQDLVFQTSNSITSLELAGGRTDQPKGEMLEIAMDDSIFDTPSTCVAAYFLHMNMRSILADATFPTTWKQLQLTNVNLVSVPSTLSNMSLTILDLSKNYITTFPNDSTSAGFDLITSLNLAENDLTSFDMVLPAVTDLNLTGNTLSTIPDAIYNMSTLKELYMNDCNLTNLVLSTDQYNFLESLTTFQADITFTGSCPENYTTTENRNQDKVCIPGTATDATTTNTKSSGSSHTVAIAVGVAGGVLVLCIIAFLIYRSRKSRETTDKNWVTMTDPTFTGGEDDISTFGSTIWNDPELLAVRVEHTSVELIKLLSRGGFGEVWLGMYMNENVAVKRLLPDKRSPSDALAFASEIKIMARLDHPKIVRFIAVSWMNAVTIQAVTEFMDCGDLKSLLDSNRAEQLTWANLKCQIAIDIADALVYLHTLNPKLIHRDLKSRNVLIDAETGAKLSDFGISRNRSVEETMTAGVGTSRWIAPEVIVGGHYTEFADIYSFGVVLSELDTCKAPFHDAANTNGGKMPDVTILQLVSAGKLQPTFEASCPASIVKLARACLSFDPAQRPSAIHISFELRKIMKEEL